MARLRRDTGQMHSQTASTRPLRIFATGTVFFTHTLLLPAYPLPGSASRAQAVHTSRGGTSGHVLSLLAQLSATSPSLGDVEPMLIASLGGNTDALRLRDALESSGVRTKYCKVWPGLGVPCAWVMHARDSGERTVINHNPLPEVSHEDFIALLGPVLAPENYVGYPQSQLQPSTGIVREQQSGSPVPLFPNALAPSAPRPSVSSRPNTSSSTNSNPTSPHAHMVPSPSPHSPAPFDWLHFEGRSIRTTVANIVGVDGLARERKWRPHCVVSVDLGRRAREGVEVINSTPTPRAILLALARHAPPHALLVLNAGQEGAALLSLPTREYLQSSGWSPPPRSPSPHGHTYSNSTATSANGTQNWDGVESVRSGSEFWASAQAGNISLASGDSAYTDHGDNSKGRDGGYRSHRHSRSGESFHPFDDGDVGDEGDDGDEQGEDGRHTPQPRKRETVAQQDGLDEEGAHCAFVAGMIWALSRRLLPGPPYAPGCHTNGNGEARKDGGTGDLGVRWRLDECLRYVGLGQDSRRRTNAARANTGSLQNLRVAEHTRV
ncbi:hypothetical protein SCLCIDRAFT_1214777 [Scleroderma citrinum Foug A]|uniref:Carbohydrate kinase PfkB domain-containing protein n=1 Tax=Scleroderma citrinum Foug A TaxID=1036808 RepID=A0A0C3E2H1_9AGAM|nr:hypothetical protein SCLCIDRAFT_1214777 [Scleroderma citrinum Foug A]